MVMLIRIGSATKKKSTLGCFFGLRSSMGYWFGKMQSCMALGTAEAKYVATCSATWERGVMKLQFVIYIEISRKREF